MKNHQVVVKSNNGLDILCTAAVSWEVAWGLLMHIRCGAVLNDVQNGEWRFCLYPYFLCINSYGHSNANCYPPVLQTEIGVSQRRY